MKRLGGLYNEFVYVCFTSKALRGLYHEALHVVYDETFPFALRGIYFIVNVTIPLRRNVRCETSVTTDV